VIEGVIYNITSYIQTHQERYRSDISSWCGKDATVGWQTKGQKNKGHSKKAGLVLRSIEVKR
jgi:hypothetical protein